MLEMERKRSEWVAVNSNTRENKGSQSVSTVAAFGEYNTWASLTHGNILDAQLGKRCGFSHIGQAYIFWQ
jgi:hypothetical protein